MSKPAVLDLFYIFCSTLVVVSKEKNDVVSSFTSSLEDNEYNN